MPARNITTCAFGGADLSTLYVTTAAMMTATGAGAAFVKKQQRPPSSPGATATWWCPTTPPRLPGCTRESPALYPYRRDGQTGRFVGVVDPKAGY